MRIHREISMIKRVARLILNWFSYIRFPFSIVSATLVVYSVSLLGWGETITPYASEAELGALIGKDTRVDGVFHQNAFGPPAIAIRGRVFFLLENPPSKHTFDFPKHSRKATVKGTLYYYDGSLQFSESYQAFGDRYYFFNIDTARIDFGEPLKASNELAKDPLESIIGDWRFDEESTGAEVYKFATGEAIHQYETLWVQVFIDSEMVVQRNRIRTYMPFKETVAGIAGKLGGLEKEWISKSQMFIPSKEVHSELQYEVIEQSDEGFVLRLTDPTLNATRDWDMKVDPEGRLLIGVKSPQLKGFRLCYRRW